MIIEIEGHKYNLDDFRYIFLARYFPITISDGRKYAEYILKISDKKKKILLEEDLSENNMFDTLKNDEEKNKMYNNILNYLTKNKYKWISFDGLEFIYHCDK